MKKMNAWKLTSPSFTDLLCVASRNGRINQGGETERAREKTGRRGTQIQEKEETVCGI